MLAGTGALLAGGVAGVGPASASEGAVADAPWDGRANAPFADRGSTPDLDVSLDGVESFVDERMTEAVEGDVVGASAAVVHGDETILATGYGEAALGGEPVDADTAFRLASITKPFVWAAAMGLIEEGRLDPDEDVNTSLESVSIDDTYDDPITMAHLATHTAGFEERNQGLWVSEPDDARALSAVLDAEQPALVRPPGEVVSYSNYGTALAGQVVADVTGRPLEAYLAAQLLEPLGMESATFEQPPLEGGATGYTAALGTPTEAPGLTAELWPAGSLSASATDVSSFLRAHLAGEGSGLLSPTVVDRTHEQWFTHHPALDGVGFGWFEDTYGDVRTLWHNGAIPGSFYGHLLLIPDADVGVFLAYNTDVGASEADAFVDAFLAEYVPRGEPSEREPDGPLEHADALQGAYRGVRVAETSHSRLFTTLSAGEVDVSVDENVLRTEIGGETARWVEREPLVFDRAEGDGTLAFEATDDGVTHLYLGHQAFRRRPVTESPALHAALGAGAGLGTLSGLVGWPAHYGWRRFRGGAANADTSFDAVGAGETPPSDGTSAPSSDTDASATSPAVDTSAPPTDDATRQSRSSVGGSASATEASRMLDELPFLGGRLRSLDPSSLARWTLGASIALVFTFLVGFGAGVVFDPTLLPDPPLWYRTLLILPVLAAIGTLVSVGFAVLAWRSGSWRRRTAVHYALVALSTATACWMLSFWNLFGTTG